jgi:hypothetical protein
MTEEQWAEFFAEEEAFEAKFPFAWNGRYETLFTARRTYEWAFGA